MWVITRKGEPATLLELLNTYGQRELPFFPEAESDLNKKYFITGLKQKEVQERYCRLVGVEDWKMRGKGVESEKMIAPRKIKEARAILQELATDWDLSISLDDMLNKISRRLW